MTILEQVAEANLRRGVTAPGPDAPHESGNDRYSIYVLRAGERRRLADTSRDGIGITLVTLAEEGEITQLDSLGILDRETRKWIANPWAKGGAR